MIEVALALGILAVGILAVVGMFPGGLALTRDTIGESYAADSAEHVLSLLSLRIRDSADEYANWAEYGTSLQTEKPGGQEVEDPNYPDPDHPWSWSEWYTADTTTILIGGANNELYHVKVGGSVSGHIDFEGIYRLWREPIQVWRYDASQASPWVPETIDESIAFRVNMEVSWPESLPYARRHKALYCKDMYKAAGGS